MHIKPTDTKSDDNVDVLNFGNMLFVPDAVQHAAIREHDGRPLVKVQPKTKRPKLFILRGQPGAGKTTIAKTMVEEGLADKHHEQDHFFMDENMAYHYDPRRVKDAVLYCAQKVEEDLRKGLRVVVANNFTKLWTVTKYIETARKCNAEVVVMRATGRYPNTMGVPEHQVNQMIDLYEPYDNEIYI